ncbi:MAG: hypothetical protein ACQXXK_03045 [Methanothrix sp.]
MCEGQDVAIGSRREARCRRAEGPGMMALVSALRYILLGWRREFELPV